MSTWPDIPWEAWAPTARYLHGMAQIIGKWRLAHTHWVNHSWHATLYVTPRGLTTGPVLDNGRLISVSLDFCDMLLVAEAEGGRRETRPLRSGSISAFYRDVSTVIDSVGGRFDIHGAPNEIPDPIPFEKDVAERFWDSDAVLNFHRAIVRINHVMSIFRTSYIGKVSPVHLFWGSFDLAVTRFSGRHAPLHPGGIPNLPDAVTHEAYSHEVSSCGFWPGEGVGEPMFYAYSYPTAELFSEAKVKPSAAYWHADLGEFLLPYEAVRKSATPEEDLLAFFQSTYAAAADLGEWNRSMLECQPGQPGIPRQLP